MLLKKLGDELMEEFLEVMHYLGEEQGIRVLVEPGDYDMLVRCMVDPRHDSCISTLVACSLFSLVLPQKLHHFPALYGIRTVLLRHVDPG